MPNKNYQTAVLCISDIIFQFLISQSVRFLIAIAHHRQVGVSPCSRNELNGDNKN